MKFKFAIVEGERRGAQRGLSGKCPLCDDAMIAKCGEVGVWQWAHPRASIVKAKPLTYSLPSNEGVLLRDWINSHNPVFFDFGEKSEPGDSLLFHTPVLLL